MTERRGKGVNLKEVYGHRFSDADAAEKDKIWRELCAFLQRFVDPRGAVLDIACARGDFIRNISAREKWATDLRDVAEHLPADVEFVRANGLEIDAALPTAHFDAIFMSNYLEHLPSNGAVVLQLRVARKLVKPRGRLIVLQPNIRLLGGKYWNFIDHSVALTDHSLVEAAQIAGFRAERVIARFLPYTTKARLPRAPELVRAYLRFPPLWGVFGKQTLYICATAEP